MKFKKGDIPWIKGKLHSEETKRKMSLKVTGSGNSQYGIPHSEEHKRKIGLAITGEKHPMFGKKHTQETKRKIKDARAKQVIKRGYKISEEKKEKIFTKEYRIKIGNNWKGEKNPNWKGGITPIHKSIRESLEYRDWRKLVFKKDNWTCVFCGIRNGNGKTVYLQADHIKPFAHFPELRFAIDNGRTLCIECHRKTDTYGSKIIKSNKY